MAEQKKVGKNSAIYAALAANVGVFVVKTIAAIISQSSSMFSEAVHSLSDTANEVILLIGKKQARKQSREHHFEFGGYRIRYLASFTVAVLLFFVGGIFSVNQALDKIRVILSGGTEVETHAALIVSAIVLVLCAVMEGASLHKSVKQAHQEMKERDFKGNLWQFWKETKSSELAVVMTEDSLALGSLVFAVAGLGGTLITNNPLYDAFGGAAVGVVLVIGAVALAKKIGGLLIGEPLTPEEKAAIIEQVESTPQVERFINMQTVALSEDHVLVCLKIEVSHDEMTDNALVTNEIEGKVRMTFPWYTFEVYVESDHYRPDYEPAEPLLEAAED